MKRHLDSQGSAGSVRSFLDCRSERRLHDRHRRVAPAAAAASLPLLGLRRGGGGILPSGGSMIIDVRLLVLRTELKTALYAPSTSPKAAFSRPHCAALIRRLGFVQRRNFSIGKHGLVQHWQQSVRTEHSPSRTTCPADPVRPKWSWGQAGLRECRRLWRDGSGGLELVSGCAWKRRRRRYHYDGDSREHLRL